MSLISLLLTAFSISSIVTFNSSEKSINDIKYKNVLSEQIPKYKTLEITETPANKYYFAPSTYQKPVYKKINITSKLTPTITVVLSNRIETSITSKPTQIITSKPTSFPSPTTFLVITVKPTEQPTILSKEGYIMNEINNYRVSKGLSKSQTDSNTCDFAKVRAAEISTSFNHDGFTNRINDKTLPYPSYSSITENISMNSDYKMVAQRWIESSGHAENMLKNTPFICVRNNGDYYTMEGWKP